MRYYINCLTVLMASVLLLSACKKNFLDKVPDEDMNLDEVFKERLYAERFLTATYNYLPPEIDFAESPGRNPFVGASDDMEMTWQNRFAHVMGSGSWGPSNVQDGHWTVGYQAIRRLNLFTEKIVGTPMDENAKKVWIGEATFLKGFFYFWMVRLYGPVPLVEKSFQPDENFAGLVRAPLVDCINYIVAQCDAAAAVLPNRVTADRQGKVTRAAALALKSRALLYLASPLWNGNPDYADFKDKEGTKLFPDYSAQRWQDAATAAKNCIDEVEKAGYKLYRSPENDPVKNYQQLFIRNNDEVLFAHNAGIGYHQEMCAAPNSMGGWSGYCPLQTLVDAYEMADGSTPITGYNADATPIINPASGYKETGYAATASPQGYYPAGVRNMYVNREPRFYATVNFSGSIWRGRMLEFWNSGVDGKSKGGAELYTITGYLLKKFMEESVNIAENKFTLKTWNYFRLGEQYLNYAEALNEAQGPVADVHKYVNAIRNRAGLPPLSASLNKEEMRARIWHERQIELAFETHRYFDTRRWKIADKTNAMSLYGMNITVGQSLQDDNYYKRTFIKKRVFDKGKHYLWPISQNELNKTPGLIQNPGW